MNARTKQWLARLRAAFHIGVATAALWFSLRLATAAADCGPDLVAYGPLGPLPATGYALASVAVAMLTVGLGPAIAESVAQGWPPKTNGEGA